MTNPNPRASSGNSSNKALLAFPKGEGARGLNLPWPPSVNRRWKRGKTGIYLNPAHTHWQSSADNMVMEQKPLPRVVGRFTAAILADERMRFNKKGEIKKIDIDNRIKCVLDYLERIEVIEGDHLADKVSIEWSKDVEGVRVTVCPV
jgi:Holliday junction resolvase RusA-like endonuclease